MEDFRTYLSSQFHLSPEQALVFANKWEVKNLAKAKFFVRHGDPCDRIGFVLDGFLKCVLVGESREVVDDFAGPNQFVANYYAFLQQKPSTKYIEAITEVKLLTIHRTALGELAEEHAFLYDMGRKVAEALFLSTHRKYEHLRLKSATERYEALCSWGGALLQEVPQYEIASYLNVTPETLSRIRSRSRDRN